jgi:hypothetical protein
MIAQLKQAGQRLVSATARAADIGDRSQLVGDDMHLAEPSQQTDGTKPSICVVCHLAERDGEGFEGNSVAVRKVARAIHNGLANAWASHPSQAGYRELDRQLKFTATSQRGQKIPERVTVIPPVIRQRQTVRHPGRRRVG